MTCATAIASWIGEPSKPYERSWKRLEEVRELGDEAAGRAGAAQALGVLAREESLVSDVEPDHRERDAAPEDGGRRPPGRRTTLNSAAGVMLPSAIAPPIQTMRSRRSRTSGCRSSISATFVSGAVGTSTTPGSMSCGEEVGCVHVDGLRRGLG